MTGPAWLVLPTFNEAENLETVVAAARRVLGAAAPEGFRVLVVDDDSPDGTGALADELAAAHPGEVEVLHRPVREGLGPAYLAGFARALVGWRGLRVRDGRRPLPRPGGPRAAARGRARRRRRPRAGLALRRPAAASPTGASSGASSAAAGRGTRGAPSGLQVRDLTGGFKCFRADVLREIDLPSVRSRGYAFQVELTYRTIVRGLRVVEVPIVFRDRELGTSKMSWQITAEAAWLVPQLRRGAEHLRHPAAEPSRRRHRRAESIQGERQRARPRPGHG